jgi:CO dehydrogenase/acetyl-CoA synthase beta subunit
VLQLPTERHTGKNKDHGKRPVTRRREGEEEREGEEREEEEVGGTTMQQAGPRFQVPSLTMTTEII